MSAAPRVVLRSLGSAAEALGAIARLAADPRDEVNETGVLGCLATLQRNVDHYGVPPVLMGAFVAATDECVLAVVGAPPVVPLMIACLEAELDRPEVIDACEALATMLANGGVLNTAGTVARVAEIKGARAAVLRVLPALGITELSPSSELNVWAATSETLQPPRANSDVRVVRFDPADSHHVAELRAMITEFMAPLAVARGPEAQADAAATAEMHVREYTTMPPSHRGVFLAFPLIAAGDKEVGDSTAVRALGYAAYTAPTASSLRIRSVFTRPESRGRGVGAAVTFAAASFVLSAEGAGKKVCAIVVADDNATAQGVYARVGFRHQRRVLDVPLSRPADVSSS